MKNMTVAEFKSNFSEALESVRGGETIIVSYGRGHRKVAALIPYSDLKVAKARPLGLLTAKVQVKFASDFALDDEQFLNS